MPTLFHFISENVKAILHKGCRAAAIINQRLTSDFRHIVQKFRRQTDACQEILVQYDGKYASRCAAKASAALCAVLPYTLSLVSLVTETSAAG